MIYEIYWQLIGVYIISMVLQLYYIYTRTINSLEIFILIALNMFCIIILFLENPQPFQEPETSEFIALGSSMQDAMYGRKYNYDMIVNHQKQKEISGNIHTNLVNMNL